MSDHRSESRTERIPENAVPAPDPAEMTLAEELETVVLDFEDIQADLNYRQARQALQELVERLDLSDRERAGLEPDLQGLEQLRQRLEKMVVQIAVFGMVGRGKSSVLNALLGQEVFQTGPTHGVTQTVQSAHWSMRQDALVGSDRDILRVSLPGLGNSSIEFIDTPGIDEVGGEAREQLARQVAQQADLILFVVSGDITQVEHDALILLRQASKPMLLVFNKIDQYPEADRQVIYQTIRDRRVRELLTPDEIVMTAASPRVVRAVRRADGSLATQAMQGTPEVTELKLKILEILHREGKSLVALNTMLYADDVNEKVVQRKMEIRDRAANQVIWNSVITKAVAIALNPVMVLDLLSGAVIDLAMILTLSRLYGINMTQQGALNLLKTIALGMGGITASETVTTLGLGSLKSLLGLSAPATGGASLLPYLSVALTQGSVAGVSSYGIGQITKLYLAKGATWGPDGPKTVVRQILDSLDETSILNRIKNELQSRLESRFQ